MQRPVTHWSPESQGDPTGRVPPMPGVAEQTPLTQNVLAQSLDIVDACGLTFLHVFPYSPRKGTPAARMPQVDRATIKARAADLRARAEAALSHHLAEQKGARVDLLMERSDLGRTRQFVEVRVDRAQPVGSIVVADVVGHDGQRLIAEVAA